jgi:hypothetical protein
MIDGGKFFYTKPTLTMNGIEMLIKLTNHIALCIKKIYLCVREFGYLLWMQMLLVRIK